MRWVNLYAISFMCALSCTAIASELSGKVTVEKKAMKKSVAGPAYDLRGMAVVDASFDQHRTNDFEKVAIWLESPAVASPSPVLATLEQRNKRFEPDLLVVPVGSTVDFPNMDPIFHNIFSLSRTQSFDLGYYSEGHSRSVKFSGAGIVQVYCHVHPEMHAVIIVTSTRWSGKPRGDGTFSWAEIPPGKYKLYVWQRSAGLIHRNIVIPETGSVHVNIALPDDSDN